MKKFISLLMILLTVSFAAFAAPALSLSEGNLDGLTLYAPDGTKLDSLSDVGESGMVIRTGDAAVAFTSDYGDIHLSEDSLLAVTGFNLTDPSLYLVYGEMSIVLHGGFPMKIFTPSSSVTLQAAGEYSFSSTDSAEVYRNFSDETVQAYDGIRGITEEVGSMEELNYLMWPREAETVSAAVYYAYSATGSRVVRDTPKTPASPSIEEPSVSVKTEPVIVTLGSEGVIGTEIAEPEYITPAEETQAPVSAEETAEPVTTPAEEETDAVSTAEAEPEEVVPAEEETAPSLPPVAPISTVEPVSGEKKDSIFSGTLEAGYDYIIGSGESIFEITPSIRIGNDDYSIGLRAPIRLTLSGSDFYLGGFNGYERWDFGKSESDESMKIYRAVTDSFALIDSLTLGHEETSLAYINADRGYLKNSTLFMDYGTDDALALRMGFNFPNLSLSIYADNAQAPHIVEGGFTFYPGRFGGPSLSIMVPGEILMGKTFKDYALLFYPGMSIDIPFAEDYSIGLFAFGEVSSIYRNGTMVNSNIIFNFETSSMCSYMAGLSFDMDLDTVSLSVDGGIRNGSLSPARFNAVTAHSNRIAGTLDELAAEAGSNEIKIFAKADLGLDFGFIRLNAGYAVSDISGYSSNPGDYLSLSISGDIGESVNLYAEFAKENFTASFSDTEDYFTRDAVFAVGADFTFGNAAFGAEFRSIFTDSVSEYVNVPSYSGLADTELAIKARLFF